MTTNWQEALGMEEAIENAISVEEALLSATSLSSGDFDNREVIELAKLSLDFLAGLAAPTMFRYLFPPVLQAVWKLLCESIVKPRVEDKIALGIPRGHGKTTLIKLFVLYVILFTDIKFILILSETGPKAEAIIADIIDMLNEPNIINTFGDWKVGLEMDRQDVKKFGFRGRVVILAGLGAGGSLRGMNIKNDRPELMIFDDVQSKECSESDVQSNHLETWMVGTAMKARSPHRCLTLFLGNMFPGKNSILKKLKLNPNWIKFISGAILADGTVLWSELRSMQSLIDELNSDISLGHPEIFFSEVMNDTEVAINNKVDLSLIKPWPWGQSELPQGKFILVDPAPGKSGRDPVAIGYFEVYDEVPGLREVIEEELSPKASIYKCLLLCIRHNVKLVACEGTAYQSTWLYWFNEICKDMNIQGIEFVEVHTNAVSKNTRITEMLRSLPAGDVVFHPSVKDIVTTQIVNWNPLKRDNKDGILDLLAYTPQVLDKYSALLATDTSSQIQETEGGVLEGQWAF